MPSLLTTRDPQGGMRFRPLAIPLLIAAIAVPVAAAMALSGTQLGAGLGMAVGRSPRRRSSCSRLAPSQRAGSRLRRARTPAIASSWSPSRRQRRNRPSESPSSPGRRPTSGWWSRSRASAWTAGSPRRTKPAIRPRQGWPRRGDPGRRGPAGERIDRRPGPSPGPRGRAPRLLGRRGHPAHRRGRDPLGKVEARLGLLRGGSPR